MFNPSAKSFWQAGFILGVVAGLAYLPHVFRLGYSHDDWYLMYDAYTQGASFFTYNFASDRPGRAPVMMLFYGLFGPTALYYHLSAFLFRWLSGLSVLWIFRLIWPERKRLAFSIAALFLLYPGFLSQTNAIDYQSHILALCSAFLSIGLSLKFVLVNKPWQKISFGILAVLTGWLYLSQMEYFIGLEAFRWLAHFLLVSKNQVDSIWRAGLKTLRQWAIFSLIPIGFLVWRLFFFAPERRSTDIGTQLTQGLTSPLGLMWWFIYLIQDVINVLITSWIWPLYHLAFQMRLSDTLLGMGLAIFAALLVVWWLSRDSFIEQNNNHLQKAFAVGLLALIAGQIPIILANRHVSFPDFSRYTLTGMIGSVMLIAVFIHSQKNKMVQTGLMVLLIFISVFSHFSNGLKAATEWETMRNFWWQVSWRVPNIKNDTTLIASYPQIAIQEDYFVWGPANLIYRQEKQDLIPIKIQIPAAVLTEDVMVQLIQGRGAEKQERRGNLSERDFGNALILSQASAGGCVRVLDNQFLELSQLDDPRVILAAPASNLSAVQTNVPTATPPAVIFGLEPPRGWCYYYQKASLARQQGDWQTVANLGKQALDLGLYPSDRVEWLLFLQAYAVLGDKAQFRKLIPILLEEPFLAVQACKNLTNLDNLNSEIKQEVQKTFCNLN